MDASSFEALLLQLNSPMADKRGEAEIQLAQLRQNPDTLLQLMVNALLLAQDPLVKECACVYFRRVFLCYPDSEPLLWTVVSESIRASAQYMLLEALQTEQQPSIRRKICHCVSTIAKILGDPLSEKWPELLPTLFQLVLTPEGPQQANAWVVALELLGALPTIFGDNLQKYAEMIHSLMTKAMTSVLVSPLVATHAIEAICELLLCIDLYKEQKPFADLIVFSVKVVEHLYSVNDKEYLPRVLQALTNLATDCPRLFDACGSDVIWLMTSEVDKQCHKGENVDIFPMELPMLLIEQRPKVYRKIPNIVTTLCPVILKLMAKIDTEDTDDWTLSDDPEMDFEADSPALCGEQSLVRITLSLGGKMVYPVVGQLAFEMLHQSDWQSVHAALMVIANIGQGCREEMGNDLMRIVGTVLQFLQHSHPRVRYAACNTLGQLATDYSPDIQDNYLEQILPALLNTMNDSNPRVQAHSVAAIINVVEGMFDSEPLTPYMDPLLTGLYQLLGNPRAVVLEQALRTTATIAGVAQEAFTTYCPHFIAPLLTLLETIMDSSQRLLRGKALECASLIGVAVGREEFEPYSARLMQQILAIAPDQWGPEDPQTLYAQEALIRMCGIMGKEFSVYLPVFMPALLKAAKLVADVTVINDDGLPPSNLDDDWSVFDTNNKAAATTMPVLLRCIVTSEKGHTNLCSYWQRIIKDILPAIHHEVTPTVLADLLAGLRMCIEVVGEATGATGLTDANFIKLSDGLKHHIGGAMARAVRRERNRHQDDEEDEDAWEMDREEDAADDAVLKEASDLIRAILKVDKQNALPFFDSLVELLATMVHPGHQANEKQLALCVFSYVIEGCGHQGWERYHDVFERETLTALTNESADVRQSAAYALGILVQYGGEDVIPLAT
eukprot:Ihof_evm2s517 gene=Ihof_evmTU2s517